jgi:conjugative transfer region protein TrbK
MDEKTLARLGAIIFIALAITATVIDVTRKKDAPNGAGVQPAIAPVADPLRDELINCQLLGEAGARDAACLRVWAENRRRFLTPGARPDVESPDPKPPSAAEPSEAR